MTEAMITELAYVLIAFPIALFAYSYFGYPAILWLLGRLRGRRPAVTDPAEWPTISITIPAYNEAHSIRDTIEALLALPYPPERRQILIVSDASTDGTDDAVLEYADRGVELLRMPERGGKTIAENRAAAHLRGDIVVNMDATIRLTPGSLQRLVRVFQDPTVGVASGRDVSVGDVEREGNQAESGYVGYEMWVRDLETALGTIVGASGCFYAIRRELIATDFPGALSRDFASPLLARRAGFRSVSVREATCIVPRARSLKVEYRRKVRTMARGLDTLIYMSDLLNPFRYGLFAWMLFSHKLVRWLVFLTAPLVVIGLGLLSPAPLARALLAALMVGAVLGFIGLRWPEGRKVPALFSVPGFIVASFAAGLAAWWKALQGERNPIWEPTRRPGPVEAQGARVEEGTASALVESR